MPQRVCLFFREGKCVKGNECRYLHSGQSGAEKRRYKIKKEVRRGEGEGEDESVGVSDVGVNDECVGVNGDVVVSGVSGDVGKNGSVKSKSRLKYALKKDRLVVDDVDDTINDRPFENDSVVVDDVDSMNDRPVVDDSIVKNDQLEVGNVTRVKSRSKYALKKDRLVVDDVDDSMKDKPVIDDSVVVNNAKKAQKKAPIKSKSRPKYALKKDQNESVNVQKELSENEKNVNANVGTKKSFQNSRLKYSLKKDESVKEDSSSIEKKDNMTNSTSHGQTLGSQPVGSNTKDVTPNQETSLSSRHKYKLKKDTVSNEPDPKEENLRTDEKTATSTGNSRIKYTLKKEQKPKESNVTNLPERVTPETIPKTNTQSKKDVSKKTESISVGTFENSKIDTRRHYKLQKDATSKDTHKIDTSNEHSPIIDLPKRKVYKIVRTKTPVDPPTETNNETKYSHPRKEEYTPRDKKTGSQSTQAKIYNTSSTTKKTDSHRQQEPTSKEDVVPIQTRTETTEKKQKSAKPKKKPDFVVPIVQSFDDFEVDVTPVRRQTRYEQKIQNSRSKKKKTKAKETENKSENNENKAQPEKKVQQKQTQKNTEPKQKQREPTQHRKICKVCDVEIDIRNKHSHVQSKVHKDAIKTQQELKEKDQARKKAEEKRNRKERQCKICDNYFYDQEYLEHVWECKSRSKGNPRPRYQESEEYKERMKKRTDTNNYHDYSSNYKSNNASSRSTHSRRDEDDVFEFFMRGFFENMFNFGSQSNTHSHSHHNHRVHRTPVVRKDYYSLLEVESTATDLEIRKAYRKKALKLHPDKPDGDEAKFKELVEAYGVLSDPKLREEFDQGDVDINIDFSDIFRKGGGFGGFY